LAPREPQADSSPPRYEVADVSPLLLIVLASLIALCVAGVLLAVTIGYPSASRPYDRGRVAPLPPAPRLQTAPAADLQRYQAAKRTELQGKGRGPRVPIDQAMRETAEQGWGRQ
jgi:hypothetical protein